MEASQFQLRQAAIFVSSLDLASADEVLAQLDPDTAAKLRAMCMELGEISGEEEEAALRAMCAATGREPAEEVIPAQEIKVPLAAANAAGDTFTVRSAYEEQRTPFERLLRVGHHELLRILEQERPQTIALVLSHLPAERAARVLTGLASDLQLEVIRRLVHLGPAHPDAMREVEHGLAARLSAFEPVDEAAEAPGLESLQRILSAVDPTMQDGILAKLSQHDRGLAERLQPERMHFDDLARLPDREWVELVLAADAEVATLALAGAPLELVERLLASLPPSAAKRLRHALAHLGPTRLSDVEHAQHELARLADRMLQPVATGGGVRWAA
jgi:flagellar motor switch protein FliG